MVQWGHIFQLFLDVQVLLLWQKKTETKNKRKNNERCSSGWVYVLKNNLLTCQVRVFVKRDSGLCRCICVKSFKYVLIPLFVDSEQKGEKWMCWILHVLSCNRHNTVHSWLKYSPCFHKNVWWDRFFLFLHCQCQSTERK